MKISIVMLCHNHWEMSHGAITSLVSSFTPTLRAQGIELLIIDNGSTDETPTEGPIIAATLSDPSVSISFVRLSENLGIPTGMNVGLAQSTGDIITFVNNDLVFPYGWLDAIIEALQEDPSLGLAVPYMTYTAILEQRAAPNYPTIAEMNAYAQQFMAETKGRKTSVGRIITSCVACRRDLLDKIGGIDFWFGIGSSDDDDWSARAQIAGYQNAIIGGTFVHHFGSATFRQMPSSLHVYQLNGDKFRRKAATMVNVPYSREMHYIPLKKDDFNPPESLQNPFLHFLKEKRVLLIADWLNENSGWQDQFSRILKHKRGHLYLLIPPMYFNIDDVAKIVHVTVKEKKLGPKSARFHLLYQNVPHVDLLNFMLRFDSVAEVPNDLVNRSARYLLKSSRL